MSNACAGAIAARISAEGPLRFSEFMRLALYHPEHGYYMRIPHGADPFGKEGDFFTAVQMQPVFGRLMRNLAERLNHHEVVDWGAGREEMREAFDGLDYRAVHARDGGGTLSERALIFANELFDALPVDLAVRRDGVWRERRVTHAADSFQWIDGDPLSADWLAYAEEAEKYFLQDEDELLLELPVAMESVVEAMSGAVRCGHLLAIDYGYTSRELIRFPQGTLMSYRRHSAKDDVLHDPGLQDITAHVPFDHLERVAARHGWRRARWESMASLLMHCGENDQFASALAYASEADEQRLRLQLKTLLFGMGETFRALLLERPEGSGTAEKEGRQK